MENQSEVQKPAALERKRFLSLVGKSLLGLWLLQLLPANLTGLKLRREPKAPPLSSKSPVKVAIHPMAVKRDA
jgi:hypothetical protein